MQENQINIEQTINIKVTDLLKKFKHREDRYNFCRQNGKYFLFIFFCIL